jgi:hypothetical protein
VAQKPRTAQGETSTGHEQTNAGNSDQTDRQTCFFFSVPSMTFGWLVLVFRDRVSLCSPGCPGTHSVDQAVLELRDWPTSASQVLGLKVCAPTTWLIFFFFFTVCVCVCVCVCLRTLGRPEESSWSWGYRWLCSYPVWMLGPELRSWA